MAVTLDLDDIQGLVARGYGDLRSASFVLVSITDRTRAGDWLSTIAGSVTGARTRPGDTAFNLAFTAGGLAKLGLPLATIRLFSAEFANGMTSPHRSRLLGDEGECSPDTWAWGGPDTPSVDAVLLLYAADDRGLEASGASHARRLEEHGLTEVATLGTSDLDGVEPFGFRDGISQPLVEGLPRRGIPDNTVRAGEFVLGYPNEYGLYTSRPVLRREDDPAGLLPRDPSGSGQPDLGCNGSYLVFRQLAQDTEGFWDFVGRATASPDGADPPGAIALAARMVGRWPGGAPLVLAPDADDPSLADANDFGYFDEDRHGMRCPIGAHVRRTHPRDSLDPRPGSAQSVAVGKRHRLLRRGREYGSPGTGEQGLHFMCLNANISRQFEFVQHSWINDRHFNGLHDEPDPLVSPSSGAEYRMPGVPVRRRLTGLPRFVTVRGGAYFFLPGLRGLRYLAARAGEVEP